MLEGLIVDEERLARGRQSEELARWLREAGRRKIVPRITRVHDRVNALVKADPVRLPQLSVFAVLAFSCLQYFYADALLQVYSIHSLIVFILVNGRIG
jgi:hypothetical protein